MRPDLKLWFALLSVSGGLLASQFLTLPRLKRFVLEATANDAMSSIQSRALDLVFRHWRELVSSDELLIGASIVLGLSYLAYAELSRAALTNLLLRVEASPRSTFAALGLLSLVVTRYYLSPGDVFMGDTEAHTIRSWMVLENLRRFQLPVWSNYWYGGYPIVEHYGPLYFTVTALLTFALGSVHLATKVLLWLTHVASVFVMYLFLREVTRKEFPALVGACAYLLSFHRVHILLYRGDLQLAIVYLLYPAILLVIERFLRTRQRPARSFLFLAFLLTALILNHHGYAFFGMVFLGVYLLVRLGLAGMEWRERFRLLTFFTLAFVSAALLSAFSLVPFVAGGELVRGMRETPFSILIPSLRAPLVLLEMFRWSPNGGNDNVGYIGLSIAVFALVGLSRAPRDRVGPALALAAGALTSLFMMRNFIDYNVKNTNFFMFFLAALSAWAPLSLEPLAPRIPILRTIRRRREGAFPATLTLILVGILLLDLGPTTFHSVFRENYGFKERMYERIRAIDGNHKVIEHVVLKYVPGADGERYFEPGNPGIVTAHSPIFTPLGRFHEGAAKSFGFDAEMVKNLQRELHRDRISEISFDALLLLGVKYVLFRDRFQYYTPRLEPSPYFRVHEDILELAHASPLVLSKRVVSVRDVESYDPMNIIESRRYFDAETYSFDERPFREIVEPLIRSMNLDIERGTAEQLIALDDEACGEVADAEDLEGEVLDFHADVRSVSIRYRTNIPSFGLLAYSYFPFLEVRIDGRPVDFHRSAMYHVLLSLPPGEHVVTLWGGVSPAARWSAWFSLAMLALVIPGSKRLAKGLGLDSGPASAHF